MTASDWNAPGIARRGLRAAALVLIMVSATAGGAVRADQRAVNTQPSSVFATSRALAIEAARARLALFVVANPAPVPGVEVPTPTASCPLASTETLTSAASALSAAGGVHLQVQSDPWLGGTTSSAELRPSSAPAGTIQGVPIVRCTTSRPADGQVTRAELFALTLVSGVSFGDVARLHGLDTILPATPAGIGGEMVGSCLDTADTAVCVVLWQSRNLVLGLTLEGPPAAVNTSTAGALLTNLVPVVVDTLAVVLRPPLPCDAESIRVDTGLTLLEAATCHDGWAFGTTVACPLPPGDVTTTTTTEPPCEALRDVLHVESSGWIHNGSIDIRCAENLARLGMTAVTAQKVAPVCDRNDPALRVGTIRPDTQGGRVSALQIALVNIGYDMPVDGRYGPITESAVVDFQIANGLTVDGVTGRQTQTALGI